MTGYQQQQVILRQMALELAQRKQAEEEANRNVATPYQDANMQNMAQDNALKQQEFDRKVAEEEEKKKAVSDFLTVYKASKQPIYGKGGSAGIYDVPDEFKDAVGGGLTGDEAPNYKLSYLTNMVMPTRNTPQTPSGVSMTPQDIPNAPLTPSADVDWQRLIAGNFKPQYSTGEITQPTPLDVPSMAKLAMNSGAMSPQEALPLMKTKDEGDALATDYKTFVAGQKEQGITSPSEISKNWHKQKVDENIASADARGKSFGDNRIINKFDVNTGHVVAVRAKVAADDPYRYHDASDPDVKSYANITKSMDSIGAFEKGATTALDYATTIAKDYGTGKFPSINKFSQIFSYYAGNPKVRGLQNAIETAAVEYMKVINAGSNITAAELTVMGQQRAKQIISASDNIDSLLNSINIMKNEAKISGDKLRNQRVEIGDRIGIPRKEETTNAPGGNAEAIAEARRRGLIK
jgi:hypothetical protein